MTEGADFPHFSHFLYDKGSTVNGQRISYRSRCWRPRLFLRILFDPHFFSSQKVETPLPCADLTTFLTLRMPQPDDPEAQTEVKERQVDDTGEKQREINQSSGMSARRLTSPSPHLSLAEDYGDPSGKLWSMYLTESGKEDEQIIKKWTEDTGGVLVFVSSKPPSTLFHV
jgi:hypothetical protein